MNQIDTERLLRSAADADPQLDLDEDAILARGHGLVRRRRLATAGGAAALLLVAALAVPTLVPQRTATPAAPPATVAPSSPAPAATPVSVELPIPGAEPGTARVGAVREGSWIHLTVQDVSATGGPAAFDLGSALWQKGVLRDDLVLVALDAVGTYVALDHASGPWDATDVRVPLSDGTTITVALVMATDPADRDATENLRWIGADGTVFRYPDVALAQAQVRTREDLPVSIVVDGDSLHLYQDGLRSAVDRTGDRYGMFVSLDDPAEGGWKHLRAGELPPDASDINVTWSDAATATAFQNTFLNDPSIGLVWFAEGTLPQSNDGRLVTVAWTDGAGVRHTIEA